VLASVGSVGDAYDNAMAESFIDSFKTELIADRTWKTRGQLELATASYIGWFNNERLHESLGDIPPVEFEALHAASLLEDHVDARERAPAEKRTAGGSLRSRYALAALSAGERDLVAIP
jgi:putative transposase